MEETKEMMDKIKRLFQGDESAFTKSERSTYNNTKKTMSDTDLTSDGEVFGEVATEQFSFFLALLGLDSKVDFVVAFLEGINGPSVNETTAEPSELIPVEVKVRRIRSQFAEIMEGNDPNVFANMFDMAKLREVAVGSMKLVFLYGELERRDRKSSEASQTQ